ncbi:hypothetical protein N035_014295 [Klebsiella pneumoniae EGD-HP19-C]|nr:hypothetical protein N035_014295 [Klebsiella pneumoniae EGD-HP19-C]
MLLRIEPKSVRVFNKLVELIDGMSTYFFPSKRSVDEKVLGLYRMISFS